MILFDLILVTSLLAVANYMFIESYAATGTLKLYSFCGGIVCVILALGLAYPDSVRYLFDKIIQILYYKVW